MSEDATVGSVGRGERGAWVAAFLVVGCLLPWGVMHWRGSSVRLTVANAASASALESVVLIAGGSRLSIGTLRAGQAHTVQLEAPLPLQVEYTVAGQKRIVEQALPAGTCCGDQLRLDVSAEGVALVDAAL